MSKGFYGTLKGFYGTLKGIYYSFFVNLLIRLFGKRVNRLKTLRTLRKTLRPLRLKKRRKLPRSSQ